ncbi:helix-turn-helix domain-containing protein [Amaricoccus sp.]|uniref:helix-turn-helix domain-containing protein n=1 Tax=Amaricoccus sp. TaxID=1872485 RepID=UPI001B437EA6|nr:helix-turn-helix domain-containing protein [Amaricoccus sp.]MBP7003760.1 helix-turn-helix domain-containing protein [Amaricoccus sp.]
MSRDPTPDLLFPTCAECQSMGVVVPGWLPAMEAELGSEAVKAFLLRHAGRQVIVPVRATPHDPAKDWLRREIGYGRLTVPMGPAARKHRQRWTALALLRGGSSLAQVAAALNVHSRTASHWRADFLQRGHLRQPHLAGIPR